VGATPKADPATPRPDFISPRLAAAMSHPTRVHAMSILLERTASPREVADQIGERLNNVTYHFNQLRKLGCIELVRTERVRGGRVLEHFYRATRRVYFDQDAWEVLDDRERLDLTAVTLRMISQDISTAMSAGSFFGPDNAHFVRSPMVVDQEGWGEVTGVIGRALEELFEVEARVAERAAAGASAEIHTKVELMQFRSPVPEEPEPGAED
jgi:DNA-binding transcriptional ArsR family regulator